MSQSVTCGFCGWNVFIPCVEGEHVDCSLYRSAMARVDRMAHRWKAKGAEWMTDQESIDEEGCGAFFGAIIDPVPFPTLNELTLWMFKASRINPRAKITLHKEPGADDIPRGPYQRG